MPWLGIILPEVLNLLARESRIPYIFISIASKVYFLYWLSK
jgi:hypothetical protein